MQHNVSCGRSQNHQACLIYITLLALEKKGKGDWVDWIPFFGCYDYQNTCSANIHIVSQNPGLENRNPINETNLILQALKIEIMWNKSYPPSLGPNYEGIKISITIKLTKADIEAKSSTDIAKSQNPIV